MFIQMSTLKPKPEFDWEVVESMKRFRNALGGAPGLIGAHTMRDAGSGTLFGLVFWASESAMLASAHLAQAAVASDPFDEWLSEPIANFRLEEVT